MRAPALLGELGGDAVHAVPELGCEFRPAFVDDLGEQQVLGRTRAPALGEHAARRAIRRPAVRDAADLEDDVDELLQPEPVSRARSVEEVGLLADDLLVERAERHVAADVLADLVAVSARHVVVDEHGRARGFGEQLRLARCAPW